MFLDARRPILALDIPPSRTAALVASAVVWTLAGAALAQDAPAPAVAGPDQLVFSTTNMNPAVSPGVDFYQYAVGGWLERVKAPERHASYGFMEIMGDGVQQQMKSVMAKAARDAATAPKGSPAQQVGTLYTAYLDTDARDAAGVTPIQSYLDTIDAVEDYDDLVRLMAGFLENGGPGLFAVLAPDADFVDNRRYVTFASDGGFGLPRGFEDVYEEPDDGPRLLAYRAYLIAVQEIAGQSEAEAARIADLTIGIERRLHAAKLRPDERVDLRAMYNPEALGELQAQIPQLNLTLLMESLHLDVPEQVIVTQPRYFPALSALLGELSMQDIRDYVRVRTIMAFSPYLTTAFDAPLMGLNQALVGISVLPPQQERALELVKSELGHPLSQLYVENFFTEATRQQAIEMIGLVKATFAERIPSREWLTPETRANALAKLDKLSFNVGYPEVWIDYSQVPVTTDLVATVAAISKFNADRLRAKLGKPVTQDLFNTPESYPITINAGYNPIRNGFEVPAAIIQAPIFDPGMDAAVNFCRLGAVIGHEMTHGFDRTGKSFDGNGNMTNWWQPADETAFDAKAQGLIDQANAYEVMPGLFGNGPLEVGENMADLGGITLAHQALQTYLAAHPEENVVIDGLTPDQRCFLAWSQLWAWQGLDAALRSAVATDNHPPNAYRAVAPLLHLDAFYDAFGIKEGDPMWLDPSRRVQAW